jgi:hypothetical protein
MFTRQLLLRLTYDLERDSDLTFADLPSQMNTPQKYQYGFEAAFQSPDESFGRKLVREFFPWKNVNRQLVADQLTKGLIDGRFIPGPPPASENQDEGLWQVIPSAPMGDLWDDRCHFWNKPGDESTFEKVFIEIGRDSRSARVQVLGYDLLDMSQTTGPKDHVWIWEHFRAHKHDSAVPVAPPGPKLLGCHSGTFSMCCLSGTPLATRGKQLKGECRRVTTSL